MNGAEFELNWMSASYIVYNNVYQYGNMLYVKWINKIKTRFELFRLNDIIILHVVVFRFVLMKIWRTTKATVELTQK